MAVTATADRATARARLVGPDVVRALALVGVVVMNYHGYLIIAGARQGDGALDKVFDPWRGPLATRFAATFVLVAGIGVTLLTRRALGDRAAVAARRWTLVRRGLLLYGAGLVFDFVWPGTILPYYGVMFVLGAVMFTWRGRWIAATGIAAAVAAAAVAWWRIERRLDGASTAWLDEPGSRSPRALVLDVFVNGTHPLLPWLAFFCTGMLLGRVLSTAWWRPLAVGAGLSLFGLATMAASARGSGARAALWSDDPFDRGLLYTASALGTALVAYGVISGVAERYAATAPVEVLRRAGQLSLTIYVAHALAFNALVDGLGVSGGLGVALLLAAGYWAVAIAAAAWWQARFGIGPVEWLYRRLSA